MIQQRNTWVFFVLFMVMPYVFALQSCSTARDFSPETDDMTPTLFWPLPPETPRVQYLRTITSPESLGIRKSFLKKIVAFFTGKQKTQMRQPYGIAVAPDERIYVADSALGAVHLFDMNKRRYRLIEGAGKIKFRFPVGITLDNQGRVYVSDVEQRAVFGLNDKGKLHVKLTGSLQRPTGVAYNPSNNLLYVVDTAQHHIQVFDLEGTAKFIIGERGSEKGQFNFPTNIAIDRQGRLYITDSMNFRVQILLPTGAFVAQFGRLGDALGDMARPKGIGIDSEGHIYVVEGLYDAINIFEPDGQLLLTFGGPGRGPGEFWLASGLYIDARNRVYLADSYNSRIQVFQYMKDVTHQ